MTLQGLLSFYAMLLLGVMAAPGGPTPAEQAVVETSPDAVVRALEAAILLSGQEGGDIRLAVWKGAFGVMGGSTWIVLVVEVEGPALLQDVQEGSLDVDLYLYALGEEREVVTALSQSLRIDLAGHRQLINASGLKIPWIFPLPSGAHLLRLLVRTGATAFGIRSLEVSGANPKTGNSISLPPVFPDRSGSWLVAIPGDRNPETAPAWLPFSSVDREFLPQALPVLRRGVAPRGLIYLAAGAATPTELEAVMRPAFGETVIRLPLTALDRRASRSPQLDILDFQLPEIDLPSGVYTAVIAVDKARIADQATTSSFNLVVVGEQAPDLWPQLDLDSTDPPPEGAIASSSSTRTGHPSRWAPSLANEEIIQEYREVLTLAANDDFGMASNNLLTLEEQSTGGLDSSGLRRLEGSQFRVHSSLAKHGAELLPVMVLHAMSTDSYRAAGRTVLARHSLRVILRLVDESLHRGLDSETRGATADLLTKVAIKEVESGNLALADVLFKEALTCAKQHPGALLGLASVYERQGRYVDAAAVFDQLWRQDPNHAEAGLRLAINLARQSQTRRARELLTLIAGADAAPWIARLAYQELARLELDKHPREAIRVLLEGLATWPNDFNLSVQLAYSLDTIGRPREALSVLRSLAPPATETAGPSPRWLYHQPPNWNQPSNLDALVTRARHWLPELREALMSSGPVVAQR